MSKEGLIEAAPETFTRDQVKSAKQKRQDLKLFAVDKELKQFDSESDGEDIDASSTSSKPPKPQKLKKSGPFNIPLPKTAHIVRPSSKMDQRGKIEERAPHKPKDYKEMEEYFGNQIEPFNMRQEKSDRLIDDNHNFLFKNVEKEQDTWLQGMDDAKEKIDDSQYETY